MAMWWTPLTPTLAYAIKVQFPLERVSAFRTHRYVSWRGSHSSYRKCSTIIFLKVQPLYFGP